MEFNLLRSQEGLGIRLTKMPMARETPIVIILNVKERLDEASPVDIT